MSEKVTINWLISEAGFENIKCVTASTNADIEISGVHIMDNPDTIRFFKNGEMVLTTGFPLKDISGERRREMVKELAEKKCSGIALKINRYFDSIPEEIIDTAMQYNIPVVQIPYEYSMSEIENKIMFQIFSLHNENLVFAHELYLAITSCVLGGNGIYGICNIIQKNTGYDVSFLDETGMVLATSENEIHLGQGSKLFNIGEIKDIRTQFEDGKFMVKKSKNFGINTIYCKLWRMISNETEMGYLCFAGKRDESASMNVIKAIEYVLPLLQIEVLRYKTTNITKIRAKAELLEQLLIKREESDWPELIYCCNIFGFKTDMAYLCLVWKCKDINIESAVKNILTTSFKKDNSEYLFGRTGDKYICIYGENKDIGVPMHIKNGEKIIQSISSMFESYSNQEYGIGLSVIGIDKIWKSYENALVSLKVNSVINTPYEIRRKQVLPELMYSYLDETEINDLYNMTFRKLVEYDKDKNGNLTETLEIYLKNDFSAKETAEELYIHRNTLNQRLSKITELIGELKGENRVRLYLGHIAMQISEKR